MKQTLTALLLVMPMALGAVQPWTLNVIAPVTNLVSIKEDLDFRMLLTGGIKPQKGDCIRHVFNNPYFEDAPETYKSFDMGEVYTQPCEFTSSHKGVCSIIDDQTFEIKFSDSNPNYKVTGSTIGKPFQSPYSSRRFNAIRTTYYEGCDLNKPLIDGTTSVSAFQQQIIRKNKVSLVSSSEKLAVPNAVLTVSFNVQSMMPHKGQVALHVPSWYTISEQRVPVQTSSDSMLGFESEAVIESPTGRGFSVERSAFDASSRTLLITYKGTSIIQAGEEVIFKITNFKNPVNQAEKTGFMLTVMDGQGYLVDQSEENLRLNTPMTEVGQLVGKEVMMLGDSAGTNIGRVFEYNKVSFFMSSYIPFEQYCYFKFVFPDKLKIDAELSIIEGDGIFKPSGSTSSLPGNYWRADINQNTVYVEGCKMPQFLNSRPFGVITFSYVLLPDYVTDTDPVQLYAYSDHAYQQLVFEESFKTGGGLSITREMLMPGFLELKEFRPSNFFAFAKNVQYTVQISPSHDMLPSTRVVLTMPDALYFDPIKGCKVTYTQGDCKVVALTNEVILTNLFKERTPGGTKLYLEIEFGDNPVGARYAGDWGARTEGVFDGQYYTVDGASNGFSFKALPGYIKSQLDYRGKMTFSEDTFYDFTFETEHNVPINGYLRLTLPFEMEFPPQLINTQRPVFTIEQNIKSVDLTGDNVKFLNVTESSIIFSFPQGHDADTHNPMRLTLEGIRTPRSFRPSSEFKVETISTLGYPIDAGGSDITVIMSKMNTMAGLEIQVDDLSNGAVTAYQFKLDSTLWLKDQDRLMITTPPQVGFGPNGLSCHVADPDAIGVTSVQCENIDEKTLAVTFLTIDRRDGAFEFIVDGLKNPPNFRRSGLFSDILMQTYDYYNTQGLIDYDRLFIQTNTPGTIRNFQLQQSTEMYGMDSLYTITFTPFNPISKDGVITLEWTDQVIFYEEDPVCKVETYQAFSTDQYCSIDFENRSLEIRNIFNQDINSAAISITLDQLRNPLTNIKLKQFKLRTFDDSAKLFAVDMLDYNPLTVCNWPCEKCSSDKDFCRKCWDRPDVTEIFLTTTTTYSTCDNECHAGYTTDGNAELRCSACDSPCGTCPDTRTKGDKYKCLTCADNYPLRMGETCVPECPPGTYQDGNQCLACSDKCATCTGDKNTCTSCKQDSKLSFLFSNQCRESCPPNMGNLAGVCFGCVYPCLECSTAPDMCTSCSQENGIAFLLGPTCTNTCPIGYIVNERERRCEGCGSGCIDCDLDDPRICLECAEGLMTMENGCVSDCPKGYYANYDNDSCRPISDLDINVIPFPCIIIAGVFFCLSYVGSRQKPKHMLIPNWLVLMGFLEHGILLSQIILTAKYGTWHYMIFIVAAWLVFCGTNIAFFILFLKNVVKRDRVFRNWRNRGSHNWAKWLITIGGFIGSWKTYKMTYSAFWGFRLTPAKFAEPANFRAIQKKFLQINIIGCYSIVLLINFIGLIDLPWGTQLYIQLIENIIIFAVLIVASIWEQKKQETDFLSDKKYNKGGRLNVMSAFQEESDQPEFSKTRQQLLTKNEIDKLFVHRKFTELVEIFGDRQCKSDYVPRDNQEDPRRCKTWPVSPDYKISDEPLEPVYDPFPNNCYSRGLTEEQMSQMKYLSKGMETKALQSDAFDADQNLRRDAILIGHHRDLADENADLRTSQERKKTRGRKNRYFQQIDNEDHEAGFLMDDDEEGMAENIKIKNDLIKVATSLDVQRQEEEKKVQQQEARQKAVTLTKENLRLKKILEEQRQVDAQDQRDIQDRIVQEEKRRQAILSDIEQARKDRMNRQKNLKGNLDAEKKARLEEIEKIKNEKTAKLKKQGVSANEIKKVQDQFNAEKARLESEFNEKLLKKQREAQANSKSPNSIDKKVKIAPQQKVVRIKPSTAPEITSPKSQTSRNKKQLKSDRTVVSGASNATPRRSSKKGTETPKRSVKNATPKRSVKSGRSDNVASPANAGARTDKINISAMMTADADDASALEGSFMATMNPAEFERRDFNEIDILGKLNRDDKGNIIVPVDPKSKKKIMKDQDGRPINQFGYLIDSNTGNVVHNRSGSVVFSAPDLDERGNIPMPFALEKFNFNPFDLLGTFFYEHLEDPLSFQKTQRGNRHIDELGRSVSLQGFLVDAQGSIVNTAGLKRFDWKQFRQFGGLMPKLYNYYGKTFELQEVMGVFDRDNKGQIQLMMGKDERGQDVYVDKAGFMVNQRGYITTRDGHICSREGKVLFLNAQLKNGEFPKIFPFTRFNISRVLGDLEMDPGGQHILQKNDEGSFIDRQGRIVNYKGFLCNKRGDVVDISGKMVFEKALLEHNGDIPEIFRSNILRSDSASSLSRFMSEIDRDQRIDSRQVPRLAGASDTSFESMMDDSPSKYDRQNMRFNQSNPDQIPYGQSIQGQPKSARWAGTIENNIAEEMSESEAGLEQRPKRKRGKAGKGYVVEEIRGRDVLMANAYGGVAKPRIRKTVPRFSSIARIDHGRTGLQTSEGQTRPKPRMQNFASKPFMETAEPSQKSALPLQRNEASSVMVNKKDEYATIQDQNTSLRTGVTFENSKVGTDRRNESNRPTTTPNTGAQELGLMQVVTPTLQMESADDIEVGPTINVQRNKRTAAQKKRQKGGAAAKVKGEKIWPKQLQMPKYDRAFEQEFEKNHKKDIDQFIEGSDFEVESLAGFSDISKGTFKSVMQNPRMKGLEKVYLQRLEFQQINSKSKKNKPKPVVKREFLDRFCDDPRYIAKGEKLKFEVGGQTQTGSDGKKKQMAHEQPYQDKQQRSQSSLLGQDVGMVQTTGLRPVETPETAHKYMTQQDYHQNINKNDE